MSRGERPHCRSRRGRSERGTSLLETLIAGSILAVGLLGLAQLMASSVSLHQLARNKEQSSTLAWAKVEQLAKLSFAADASVQITPANPNALDTNVANYFDTPAVGITRRWRVAAGPVANTRLVTVRVIQASASRNLATPVEVVTVLRQW